MHWWRHGHCPDGGTLTPPATASAGDATAEDAEFRAIARSRPIAPGDGETILWEGRPNSSTRRLLELLGLVLMLGLLGWLAIALIAPHFRGSAFAGNPTADALPLVLAMVLGTLSIIGLPVWLRSSARGRSRYMLTNRRALIWLGGRIIGEAKLFGADMALAGDTLSLVAPGLYLSWRLKDEGVDQLRFERIADAPAVAAMAEAHGARWLDRPPAPDEAGDGGSGTG